jgi:hypothetical protein
MASEWLKKNSKAPQKKKKRPLGSEIDGVVEDDD